MLNLMMKNWLKKIEQKDFDETVRGMMSEPNNINKKEAKGSVYFCNDKMS